MSIPPTVIQDLKVAIPCIEPSLFPLWPEGTIIIILLFKAMLKILENKSSTL